MTNFHGTTDELLALASGEDLNEYRREKTLRLALKGEASSYRGLLPSKWPKIHFNWTCDRTSWHQSFDGWRSEDINKHYSAGLLAGWLDLQEFDSQLCSFNRRSIADLWTSGCASKLAFVLSYLSNNHPISPVVVGFANDGQLCLHGGNHRYTAAKFSGQDRFAFLCSVRDIDRLSGMLAITWHSDGA